MSTYEKKNRKPLSRLRLVGEEHSQFGMNEALIAL